MEYLANKYTIKITKGKKKMLKYGFGVLRVQIKLLNHK